jgi:hypothetical protein
MENAIIGQELNFIFSLWNEIREDYWIDIIDRLRPELPAGFGNQDRGKQIETIRDNWTELTEDAKRFCIFQSKRALGKRRVLVMDGQIYHRWKNKVWIPESELLAIQNGASLAENENSLAMINNTTGTRWLKLSTFNYANLKAIDKNPNRAITALIFQNIEKEKLLLTIKGRARYARLK